MITTYYLTLIVKQPEWLSRLVDKYGPTTLRTENRFTVSTVMVVIIIILMRLNGSSKDGSSYPRDTMSCTSVVWTLWWRSRIASRTKTLTPFEAHLGWSQTLFHLQGSSTFSESLRWVARNVLPLQLSQVCLVASWSTLVTYSFLFLRLGYTEWRYKQSEESTNNRHIHSFWISLHPRIPCSTRLLTRTRQLLEHHPTRDLHKVDATRLEHWWREKSGHFNLHQVLSKTILLTQHKLPKIASAASTLGKPTCGVTAIIDSFRQASKFESSEIPLRVFPARARHPVEGIQQVT